VQRLRQQQGCKLAEREADLLYRVSWAGCLVGCGKVVCRAYSLLGELGMPYTDPAKAEGECSSADVAAAAGVRGCRSSRIVSWAGCFVGCGKVVCKASLLGSSACRTQTL
jgi:hypothetical protein